MSSPPSSHLRLLRAAHIDRSFSSLARFFPLPPPPALGIRRSREESSLHGRTPAWGHRRTATPRTGHYKLKTEKRSEKSRKREKIGKVKQFASRGLYFERLANWGSKDVRRANSILNIQMSSCDPIPVPTKFIFFFEIRACCTYTCTPSRLVKEVV